MEKDIKDIFDKLLKLPGAKELRTEGYLKISFPAALNSDYNFSLYLYYDNEPQICASHTIKPESFFWFHPFEIYDFDSEEERIDAFNKTVENLFTNPTRIVQKKGLISWSFSCFYFKNVKWIEVYSHSGLRISNVPPINTKEIIYQSPIVVSNI